MPPHRLILSSFLLLVPLTIAAAQDEESFEKDFARVQSLTGQGKWKSAHKRLVELLETHKNQDYLLRRRIELAEEMKRCVFYLQADFPKVDDLVSGELKSYTPSSGRIKLRYTEKNLKGDFELLTTRDWAQHSITFDGDYTITIRGREYYSEKKAVAVSVCDSSERSVLVIFGLKAHDEGNSTIRMPSRIELLEGKSPESLDYHEASPVSVGKPYICQVKVSSGAISAYYNKRKILAARRDPSWSYGGFGISLVKFDELLVEGNAQPSWIQGLQDAALQGQREAFEKKYVASEHLPQCLLADAKPASKESDDLELDLPGEISLKTLLLVRQFYRVISEDPGSKGGFDFLQGGPGKKLPEVTRQYLLAKLREIRGELDEALVHLEKVTTAEPSFLPAQLSLARLLFDTLHKERAIEVCDALIAGKDASGRVYDLYVSELLRLGYRDKACEVIEQGRKNAAAAPELARLNRMLIMAEKGPSWTKTYERKSKNYHVVSNISEEVCQRAASLLEQAYLGYRHRLTEKRLKSEERFRVYIFAGEASYLAYAKDVIGANASETAGIYSTILKQLLIWNLPEEKDMLSTIRHEGFHQFLDRVTDDSPIWFNEGLAEYYERGRMERSIFQGGQLRSEYVDYLCDEKTKKIPLERFLHIRPDEFYAHAPLSYAQAWALVHFLRHGKGRDLAVIFETLMELLQDGKTSEVALASAFKGISIEELEKRFLEYLEGLRE